ncbi:lipoprotein-anchoring transpeptidase ErfK/SrfK [Nakamurella sp. UYEF19]|uniref:L,D-transpeptidase n=1 Tax=Nakamurella sp. UYEF19 TaxID=1756392 RepID=UPI003395F8CA
MRIRPVRLFSRRTSGVVAAVAVLGLLASACSSGTEIVTVTVTPGQEAPASQVVAPDLSSGGATPSAPPTTAATAATTKAATLPANTVRVTAKPAFGTKNVPPNNPLTVTVFAAKLAQMTLTGDDGTQITGAISADKGTWTNTERLDYDTTYTYSGVAMDNGNKPTKISGKISTVKPASTEKAYIQIPDGGTVGVGAPIIITFAGVVKNRAAAEKALKVTTSAGAALQGNWGWLQDEDILGKGVVQSQVHWRPTVSPVSGTTPYWPAFTKVHVEADLKGVDYGNGQWGREDFQSDFTIGRSQIVIADASTFHLVVTVDDKVTKNYPVSYGKESVPGRGTLNGIHIVTEKHLTFAMCNPQFNYCNALEKWAVRINNNGEFIHENLKAAAAFGIANVSHGCINMGAQAAEDYYNSAIYGDPVVLSNTGGPQMSEKDAVYDWIYSPDEWKALSAL